MTVEILPVTDKATMKRFIKVPFLVHKDDKSFIPPLVSEREDFEMQRCARSEGSGVARRRRRSLCEAIQDDP